VVRNKKGVQGVRGVAGVQEEEPESRSQEDLGRDALSAPGRAFFKEKQSELGVFLAARLLDSGS
jgi:hypothetical protein